MAHIRNDLEGVVVVQSRNGLGRPVVLAAGDKIPRGVTVGDHLIAASGTIGRSAQPAKPAPEKPAPAKPDPGAEPQGQGPGPEPKAEADGEPDDSSPEEQDTPATAGDGEPEPAEQGEPVPRPPASGPGSDKGAWRRFAQSLGLTVADEASRADIQAAVEAHEQASA